MSMPQISRHFARGGNVLQLLRETTDGEPPTSSAILTAYDLQAGSYVTQMEDPTHAAAIHGFAAAVAEVLQPLKPESLLEIGVGEATTLVPLVRHLQHRPARVAGCDLSWSRIAYGRAFASRHDVDLALFVGDMFALPLMDGAYDVVFTSHAIEPNRGREEEALVELSRVARRYIVLLEPASQLGNAATKARIEEHHYCRHLADHARRLGMLVIRHELFTASTSTRNQSELLVIQLPRKAIAGDGSPALEDARGCPTCRTELVSHKQQYFCSSCCVVYPCIDGISCLIPGTGVMASRFLSF